jgi:Tfp pilus assembly protein PilO
MFNINLSRFSISDLKKYTKFIFTFIIILFLVGAYFLWWPKYQDFRKSGIDLDVESEKVKKKKAYVLELENKLNILEDYEDKLLKIGSALPLQYSASSLFTFVQKTASENGLIINEANLEEPYSLTSQTIFEVGSIQIDRIDFTVTITGNYLSFKNFLADLYKSSRLVEVKRIIITPTEQEEEEVQIPDLFDFTLGLYANYYNKIE